MDGEALDALAAEFRAALAAPDVRDARALVANAAHAGESPGRLYVEVVRPALASAPGKRATARARVATAIGEAVLADLVSALPTGERPGAGRAAVLTCRGVGAEAVDGTIAMDFLESDGWRVDRRHGPDVWEGVQSIFRHGIELAVAVTAGPDDALRLAPACARLRRLPDPPVIILCDFSGRSRHAVATMSLAADALAHDPEDLLRCAAAGLPSPGQRRWGVRLSRSAATLALTPTGRLDAASVGRLCDVAGSRQGTYSRLIVDLRELAELDATGSDQLARWSGAGWLDGVELLVLAAETTRLQLGAGFPVAVQHALAG